MGNTIIEQTEVTAVDIIEAEADIKEFIVSNFETLKSKIEAENLDIEATKTAKLAALMQEKVALFTSGKPMNELLALDTELSTKMIAVQNSGKVSLDSVVNNCAKYVLYDDVLYRYDNKQLRIATGKTLREAGATKVKTATHREKWAGKLIGFNHNDVTIPFGSTEHIDADAVNRGIADQSGKVQMSAYIKARVKEHDGANYNEQFNPSGWSNPSLVEIK